MHLIELYDPMPYGLKKVLYNHWTVLSVEINMVNIVSGKTRHFFIQTIELIHCCKIKLLFCHHGFIAQFWVFGRLDFACWTRFLIMLLQSSTNVRWILYRYQYQLYYRALWPSLRHSSGIIDSFLLCIKHTTSMINTSWFILKTPNDCLPMICTAVYPVCCSWCILTCQKHTFNSWNLQYYFILTVLSQVKT